MSVLILVDSVMCDHVEFFGRKMKASTAVLCAVLMLKYNIQSSHDTKCEHQASN